MLHLEETVTMRFYSRRLILNTVDNFEQVPQDELAR